MRAEAQTQIDRIEAALALVRQSRLSVMPLTKGQYETILQMGGLA